MVEFHIADHFQQRFLFKGLRSVVNMGSAVLIGISIFGFALSQSQANNPIVIDQVRSSGYVTREKRSEEERGKSNQTVDLNVNINFVTFNLFMFVDHNIEMQRFYLSYFLLVESELQHLKICYLFFYPVTLLPF